MHILTHSVGLELKIALIALQEKKKQLGTDPWKGHFFNFFLYSVVQFNHEKGLNQMYPS